MVKINTALNTPSNYISMITKSIYVYTYLKLLKYQNYLWHGVVTVYCQSLMDKKLLLFCVGHLIKEKRGWSLYNLGYSLNERLLLLLLLMVIGLGKLIELIQLDRFQQGLWCLYLIQIMYLCLDIKFGTIQCILLCRRHKDIWQVCRRYLKSVVWKWYLY